MNKTDMPKAHQTRAAKKAGLTVEEWLAVPTADQAEQAVFASADPNKYKKRTGVKPKRARKSK